MIADNTLQGRKVKTILIYGLSGGFLLLTAKDHYRFRVFARLIEEFEDGGMGT
jgi:hypothetical protein